LEEKKKYRQLTVLIAVLILICIVQGFFLLKDGDFSFFWWKEKDNTVETFSQSLLDEYKNNQKDHWGRFDRFFDDDFFKQRSDPFKEMEDIQRRMREMMEKDFKKPFSNAWDGWFNNRFQKESNTINLHTQEKKDSYIITITIPNSKENNLNVTVDTDGVRVEADVEQIVEKKDSAGNIIARSTVHRRLDQTYPIPPDAEYEKAQMEYKKDKVIITIPKL
jgi:HSP20 family molecular chaperone IbpA